MIVPIVEGQSEERAIGPLIRRVLHAASIYDLEVARPFRVKRQRVVRPAELAGQLLARGASETDLTVRVVFPTVEIEAWALAGVDSLRGVRGIRPDAEPPAEPEAVQDAKRALTRRMDGTRGYVATDDLPALLATVDLGLVAARSPSLAKLHRDVRSLAGL